MTETALLGGSVAIASIITLVWLVLQIVAYWKIFTKAGEAGWKSLIPFYNYYIQLKLTWKSSYFWVIMGLAVCLGIANSVMDAHPGEGDATGLIAAAVTLVLAIVLLVLMIKSYHYLSKAFGHGVGFTLGFIFFEPIFMLILGFGSSCYIGNQSV